MCTCRHFDQDIIGEDDLIAEVVINVEKELRHVMKEEYWNRKFKDPPKAAEMLSDSSSDSEGELDDSDDEEAAKNLWSQVKVKATLSWRVSL